jgi:large subunit ribosomal protein L7/L12
MPWLVSRPYSQPAGEPDAEIEASDKIKQLAADIMALTVLECSQLSKILKKELGISASMPMAMPMMAPGALAAAGPAAGAAAADATAAEETKEKTEFDVKLESFSAEGKIKVIKEIRALTNLGLKEAKELVSESFSVNKWRHKRPCEQQQQQQKTAVSNLHAQAGQYAVLDAPHLQCCRDV